MQSKISEIFVHDLPNVRTFYDKPDKPGVRKGPRESHIFPVLVQNYLSDGLIQFYEKFFTTSKQQTPETIMTELRAQLERVHEKRIPKNDKPDHVMFTGKMGTKQDDMYITLAMALHWGIIAMRRQMSDYQHPFLSR